MTLVILRAARQARSVFREVVGMLTICICMRPIASPPISSDRFERIHANQWIDGGVSRRTSSTKSPSALPRHWPLDSSGPSIANDRSQGGLASGHPLEFKRIPEHPRTPCIVRRTARTSDEAQEATRKVFPPRTVHFISQPFAEVIGVGERSGTVPGTRPEDVSGTFLELSQHRLPVHCTLLIPILS